MTYDHQLQALVVLLAAVAFFFTCYVATVAFRLRRAVKRDMIRYRLFAARDKLYLAVADGHLPVNGEEFQRMRNVINFLIRESDGAGFGEFMAVFDRKQDPTLKARIESLPSHARVPFIEVLEDVASAVYELFMLNSRLARVFIYLGKTSQKLRQTAERLDEKLDEKPVRTAQELQQRVLRARELRVAYGGPEMHAAC